jgi:hypothetical protein
MTPAQISEAQRRVIEWKKTYANQSDIKTNIARWDGDMHDSTSQYEAM